MGEQIVLLTDAYEPPTLRLVDCLHSAGVTALVEGLQEAEVVMSRERNPLARSANGPGPLAVLLEVDAIMDAEELQVAARHATNVWPEIPLVACRRVAEECSMSSLRPLDHPLLKRLGFHIIVDSPSQLPDVLRELQEIKSSQETIKSESEDALSLGNLLLPPTLKKGELRAAFELVSSLHFASDQKSAALTALAGLATMVLADRWTIYLKTETDEDKYVIEPLAVRGITKSEQAIQNNGWRRDLTEEELQFIGKESKAAREAVEKSEIVKKHEKDKQVIAVPLTSGDRVFGVLESVREGKDKRNFSRSETSLLNALVLPISASLANAVRIAEAERLSQTDDLTKLHNARFLRQCITNEIRKARRLGQNVSTLFLDIDNFKRVNDEHGHLVGSHILLEMAGVLRTSVRTTDVVTRYGGDEFVVVLPDTNLENAAVIAERIKEKLAAHIFTGGRGLNMKITASFGVAVFPEHAASPQQLMAAADAAMYEAKAAQKDCIRFANVSLTIFSQTKQ
jgi:diguanylate cyclase (GGDEF)-like protein